LADIWGSDSFHKIGNKFFFYDSQGRKEGSFVCKTVLFFCGRILIRLTWNLLRSVPNSVEILTWNFRKKLFRENFSEIFSKPRLSSTKTCEFRPTFCKKKIWVRIAPKIFTQVLPYVVFSQVRRHIHKRTTTRRYEKENQGRFVFGKPVFFPLGPGHTTPYSLCVFVWNFYQTIFTVSIEFWLRFEAQIRSTRLEINFLLMTESEQNWFSENKTSWILFPVSPFCDSFMHVPSYLGANNIWKYLCEPFQRNKDPE